MKFIHITVLALFLSCTVGFALQSTRPPSQETINAVSNERISQLESQTSQNTENITALAREVAGLKSSIDRLNGIGIGFGATLTILQVLLVLVTYLKGGKSGKI